MTIHSLALKAIKYSEALSEETLAFSANVYINGKMAGAVSNRGHGGCHELLITDKAFSEKQLNEYCLSIAPAKTEKQLAQEKKYGFSIDYDFESWANDQVTHFLYKRDLKRLLKNKTMFENSKHQIMQSTLKPTQTNIERVKTQESVLNVLNEMPFEDALSLFIKRMNA